MRKITILGLVLGFIFSSFGQLEKLWSTEVIDWNQSLAQRGNGDYIWISSNEDSLYFKDINHEVLKQIKIGFEFNGECHRSSSGIADISDASERIEEIYFSSSFFNTDDNIEFVVSSSCIDSNNNILRRYYAVMNEDGFIIHSDTSEGSDYYWFKFYEELFIVNHGDFQQAFKCPGKLSLFNSAESQPISVEDTLNIDLLTSVGEVSQNELRVWNDNNIIHYQVNEAGDFQVLIFNTNAQLQHQNDNFTGINGEFDASNLSAGMYFITINDNNEVLRSETKKIVIR